MPKLLYQSQFKTTTLSVIGGIDASQTTGIVIQSDSGLESSKPGIACLSYTEPLDLDNAEYIEYSSINTTTKEFVGVIRGAEGYSAKTHSNGVTIAFPTSKSQINRLNNALSIGGVATNGVTQTIDDPADSIDASTELVTKNYVDSKGYGGWLTRGLSGVTVTRQSVDNPTVVLRFNADLSDYIWKGTRIKVTENSIVHYFIVSLDPVYSAPNFDVTCLSEINTTTPTQAKNLLGTGTISNVAYAPPKTFPKGFPISKTSWRLRKTSTNQVQKSNPVQNTYYNLDNMSLVQPVGDWEESYRVVARLDVTNPATQVTLSDTNNTSSDSETLTTITASGPTGVNNFHIMTGRLVTTTTKKTRFLNLRTIISGASRLDIRGDITTSIINFQSTLL